MVTKNFKEVTFKSSYKALSNIFLDIAKNTPTISLWEKDDVGIEFKAGLKQDYYGFFASSPKKFANKVISKTNSNRNNTIFFFIGINEDTKDFSPIPLNRTRNEFRDTVKQELIKQGCVVWMIESIPINDNEGILLIALGKCDDF